MARKKKFAPNDSNLGIAYFRFLSPSQNEATLLLHQQVIESQRCDSFCFIWEERMERGIWSANKKREVKAFLHTKKRRQDAHG